MDKYLFIVLADAIRTLIQRISFKTPRCVHKSVVRIAEVFIIC